MSSDPDSWTYGVEVPDPGKRDLIGLKASWVVRRLPNRERLRVLEYGCGEGKYLGLVEKFAPDAELVGVDIRQPHTNPRFEFHRLEPDGLLHFADGDFDVIISCDVLEHVQSVDQSVNEIRRVLRPGGAFIGFVPLEGGATPHSFFRLFCKDLYYRTKDHRNYFTKREMLRVLTSRFKIMELAYSYHLLGGLMDATFFASFLIPSIGPKVEKFWRGSENFCYRGTDQRANPSLLARLVGVADRLAYYESRSLHNVSIGACGLHFHVEAPRPKPDFQEELLAVSLKRP